MKPQKDCTIDPQELRDKVDPSPALTAAHNKIHKLEAQVKQLKRDTGLDEQVFDFVRSGLTALHPIPKISLALKGKRPTVDGHALLTLADAHSEELVLAEEMEGQAAYSWPVFESRMAQVADKTLRLTQLMSDAARVRHLTVACLGDWFMGQIHPDENAYGSSMPLPIALPGCGRVLAEFLMRLSAAFDTVTVIGVCGNHGRTTMKPVSKATADRNWDMACYLIAREFTKRATNVRWVLPKSVMSVHDILGYKVLLTHGDCITITHRTPYFAIEDTFFKEHQARRGTVTDFDFAYIGHFHHEFQLRGEIVGVPSMIGPSQYGRNKLHTKAPAGQRLDFFTEKHGRTVIWPLDLE